MNFLHSFLSSTLGGGSGATNNENSVENNASDNNSRRHRGEQRRQSRHDNNNSNNRRTTVDSTSQQNQQQQENDQHQQRNVQNNNLDGLETSFSNAWANINSELFNNLLSGLSNPFSVDRAQTQQQQQQYQREPVSNRQKIPPASSYVLRNLPIVTTTVDDLVDPNNRQCYICFNEIVLNQLVIRLIPYCGHTFCSTGCIQPWLKQTGTCPVCRYELPTDAGYQYEHERKQRMASRKPRLAKYELYKLSIPQLKQLLLLQNSKKLQQQQNNVAGRSSSSSGEQDQQIRLPHFCDKQDIIDYIISAGDDYIDWIAAPDPVRYSVAELQSMTVSQLKRVMNEEAGVFFEKKDIVEKQDLLHYFLMSGRLEIISDTNNNNNNDEENQQFLSTKKCDVDEGDNDGDDDFADYGKKKRSLIQVETVYECDDEDNSENCKNSYQQKINNSVQWIVDERENQHIVMEEDLSFVTNTINGSTAVDCSREQRNDSCIDDKLNKDPPKTQIHNDNTTKITENSDHSMKKVGEDEMLIPSNLHSQSAADPITCKDGAVDMALQDHFASHSSIPERDEVIVEHHQSGHNSLATSTNGHDDSSIQKVDYHDVNPCLQFKDTGNRTCVDHCSRHCDDTVVGDNEQHDTKRIVSKLQNSAMEVRLPDQHMSSDIRPVSVDASDTVSVETTEHKHDGSIHTHTSEKFTNNDTIVGKEYCTKDNSGNKPQSATSIDDMVKTPIGCYDTKDEDCLNVKDSSSIRVFSHFQDRSISELKALAFELGIDLAGCVERNDVIDRLANTISSSSSNNNRTLMSDNDPDVALVVVEAIVREGLNESDIQAILSAFNIVLRPCKEGDNTNCLTTTSTQQKEEMIISLYNAALDKPNVNHFLRSLAPLVNAAQTRSVGELRTIARHWNVDLHDCLEKREMIQRLVKSRISSC